MTKCQLSPFERPKSTQLLIITDCFLVLVSTESKLVNSQRVHSELMLRSQQIVSFQYALSTDVKTRLGGAWKIDNTTDFVKRELDTGLSLPLPIFQRKRAYFPLEYPSSHPVSPCHLPASIPSLFPPPG